VASTGIGTEKSSGKEYIRLGGFQNVAPMTVKSGRLVDGSDSPDCSPEGI